MYARIILLFFIGFLLTTCKKKLPAFIEIGNRTGMDVNSINMAVSGGSWGAPAEEQIDVNNDGRIDFSFFSKYAYSPGGGLQTELSIKCTNPNFLFWGGVFDDTTFIKIDTIIHSVANVIYVEVQKLYFYSQLHLNDSIASLNHFPFRIKAMEAASLLQSSDDFESFSDIIQGNNVTNRSSYYSKNNDTITNFYSNPVINPYPYLSHKDIYFGFKLNDKKVSRLGWIKFNIIKPGELQLIETAIQKN